MNPVPKEAKARCECQQVSEEIVREVVLNVLLKAHIP